MYSYSEFKRALKYTFGLSDKDIYYIIGVFFDETNGFQHSYSKRFYTLSVDKVVYVKWLVSAYEWHIEIYDY